jgi:hypothetical protein
MCFEKYYPQITHITQILRRPFGAPPIPSEVGRCNRRKLRMTFSLNQSEIVDEGDLGNLTFLRQTHFQEPTTILER